jgi:cell division protease FtsH
VLDKALLRPGRFDRKIQVNLPNIADREEILKIHSSNKKITNNVNYKALASKTV